MILLLEVLNTTSLYIRIQTRSSQARTAAWCQHSGHCKGSRIGGNLLSRWCKDQKGVSTGVIVGRSAPVSSYEFERMRRGQANVKMERDIFKGPKLPCCRPQVKYGFVTKHRSIWPTRVMRHVLGVSASRFYDWFNLPPLRIRNLMLFNIHI